ncbi:hypothetical protein [uncultured Methylobacterium sp.]
MTIPGLVAWLSPGVVVCALIGTACLAGRAFAARAPDPQPIRVPARR